MQGMFVDDDYVDAFTYAGDAITGFSVPDGSLYPLSEIAECIINYWGGSNAHTSVQK